MSFGRKSFYVNFSVGCDGACALPRRFVTRVMPCLDPDLQRAARKNLSCYLLLSVLVLLCHVVTVEASFMHDSKAHFPRGCRDPWTLVDRVRVPTLVQVTVCMHLRVLAQGEWTAFTYGPPHVEQYDLALEGDRRTLYVWLLGVRHRFPVRLLPHRWYHVCLKRDAARHSVALDVDGSPSVRTVTGEPIPLGGDLLLGCRARHTPLSHLGEVELYLFRVWDDIGNHDTCENGTVVGWSSEEWDRGEWAPVRDDRLPCALPVGQDRSLVVTLPPPTISPPPLSTAPPPSETTLPPPTIPLPIVIPPITLTPPPPLLAATLPLSSTSPLPPLSAAPLTSLTASSSTAVTSTSPETSPEFVTPSPLTSALHTAASVTPSTLPPSTSSTSPAITSTMLPQTTSTILSPTTSTTLLPNTSTTMTPTTSTTLIPNTSTTLLPDTSSTLSVTTSTMPSPNTSTTMPPTTSTMLSPNISTTLLPITSTIMSPNISTTLLPTTPTMLSPTTSATLSPTTSLELTVNMSTTETYTLTTTPTHNNTTGPLAIQCTFPEFCANETAFYWMVLEMQATKGKKTESDISNWLSGVFNIYTCELSSQATTNMVASTTSSPQNTPSDSTTSDRGQETCPGKNETAVLLFQGIEVLCDDKEKIRITNCTVLLQLSRPTDPCVLYQALVDGSGSSSIQARLLGQVEQVAKGLCSSENVLAPGGSFEKCYSSSPVSDVCHSEHPLNVTCNSSAGKVVVPVDVQKPVKQICSQSNIIETFNCSCSTFCNDTAAYYTLSVLIVAGRITFEDVQSLVNQLGSVPPACNSSSTTSDSLCSMASTVSGVFQEAYPKCSAMFEVCTVILKLARPLDTCMIRDVLVPLFQTMPGIIYDSTLTRLAICDWPSGSTVNMSKISFPLISTDLSVSQICDLHSSSLLTCNMGETVGVSLSEMCMPGPIPPPFTAAPPNTTYSLSPTPPIDTMANTSTTFLPPNITIQHNMTTGSLKNTTTLTSSTSNITEGVTMTSPKTPTNVTKTASTTTLSTPTNSTTTAESSASPIITPGKPMTIAPASTTNPAATTVSMTTKSLETEAEGLLNLTKDVSSLNSSQVAQLVSQLENLLSGPNVSLNLGRTVITIVSNLLNASVDTLASSSNRIIGVVDTVGLKLVVQGTTETILSDSVALAVKKVDSANFQETSFSITDPSNVQISGNLKGQTNTRNIVPSSPQGSITLPASLTDNLSPEQQLLASRVQFNFYQKSTVFQDRALGKKRLNSAILGTSVANLSISNLRHNVVFTLRNNEPIPANFVASCVFWDFRRNGGSGGWNPSGCFVQNSTDEETICSCNHLTSFAVLLDISREGITNRIQSIILTYITYIGCGISAIFLSITLLTYLAFGKLRKDIPSKILIQLCTALLLLNLVFLLDSWLALYPNSVGLCISTAFFLHYFLLVSFTWMGLEALHMYLALVKVFNTYVSKYMLKFSLAGWGVPLIVVIIVIAIDKNNYGLISYGKFNDGSTDDFCWLKNDVAFYVAVVAYFCVIFVVNLSMFIVVMVQLYRIKQQNPHNVQQRSGLQDLRSVAGLTVLLGLTWGFAFFAWGPVNLPFMYLFAIFNSLQGFFIFIFHCAIKENVRKQWRTYLCCGKLRLPENTEWSRTATQNRTKKLSAIRATSFGSSNSVQSSNTSSTSSFLPSDSTERPNGIGGRHEDGQITSLDEPNGDVVMNEINSRYRTQRGQ
ncbi:mucin-5AC-like isoform X2 [Megalops cyprinoides]|uniref:mucin-5AC-like isoform X2 n=1 Tax=Megalops cyprinoides TaxID=118141 RepID=UPI0018656874|nr:mucin-5AC-like isoform X2 [Megalops cyprinoides]